MSDTVRVEASGEVADCPEWISAYVIGLSSAGLGPYTVAARLAAVARPTKATFDEAMRRTRTLPGLDSRLRWSALVALRVARTRNGTGPG